MKIRSRTFLSAVVVVVASFSFSSRADSNLQDYDGDGLADPGVYDKNTGNWYIRASSTASLFGSQPQQWGWSEAEPVPGDYDGDGKTDIAVFVPKESAWYIRKSSDGQLLGGNPVIWGGGIAVPADYDGDGLTDMATFDQVSSLWYIRKTSDGTQMGGGPIPWGGSGMFPMPADWDGDGLADLTVYNMGGRFYSYFSTLNQEIMNWLNPQYQNFPGYFVPVAADFDADGETEAVTYQTKAKLLVGDYGPIGFKRAGTWGSIPPNSASLRFGVRGAYPVASDFTGDGKADLAYYDPRTATWAVNGLGSFPLGVKGCVPTDNQIRIMRAYGLLR
jgi:FG-GAP-like repeat/FG-GAP repeat